MKGKRAAIYVRVSTHDQRLDLQIDQTRAYCNVRDWTVSHVFEDVGSGALRQRPQLGGLMDLVRKRRVDHVVVWRRDRIARDLRHLLELHTELQEHHVGLVSVTESIDTSTAAGKLMLHVLASLAEFERDVLRERTIAGLEARRARGIRLGPKPKRVDVDAIRELHGEGISERAIAARLGLTRGMVVRRLKAGGA